MAKKKTAVALNAAGLGLLIVFGWLFLLVGAAVRPELSSPQIGVVLDGLDLVGLLLGLVGVLLLHELIHGLFFWRFTGERPEFGFNLLYAYAAAPDWYIPRNQFLVVGLAPLLLLTLAGLILLPFVPFPAVPLLLLALTINAAGAVGDLIVVGWLLTQPSTLLAHDTGPAITLYLPAPQKAANLHQRWNDLMRALGVSPEAAQQAFADLAAHYSEHGRYYHTLDHVAWVLDTVATLQGIAQNYRAIQLAAWFHDVIYDPGAADNEVRSAAYARAVLKRLDIPTRITDKVTDLILATETHRAAEDDVDAQILLDSDLATLAASPAEYAAYARAIRKEYAWVPEAEYRIRRKQLLVDFIERERIYQTDSMFMALEGRARHNLATELERLGHLRAGGLH